jgi:hypothetical protein
MKIANHGEWYDRTFYMWFAAAELRIGDLRQSTKSLQSGPLAQGERL